MPLNIEGYEIRGRDVRLYEQTNIVRSGLVLHLDASIFNTVTYGTTWFDISGNGNNGTMVNGPTFNSGNGGSLVFDGVNDYVILTRPSSIVTGGSITISIWAKWTTVGTTTSTIQALVDNNHTNTIGFVIQDRPDLNKSLTAGGTQSTFVVGDNTWRSIIFTNDQTTSKLYINGTLDNQVAEGGLKTVQPNISIGAWQNGPGRFLNGSVGSVQLYNRALSAAEILHNYNVTKGRFGL
jgi:hypothetical protein